MENLTNTNLVLTNKIYTLKEIEKMSKDIFKRFEIERAYIFGSYAREEAKVNSDIDIMIKTSDTFSFLQLSSMANILMIAFRKEIDIITEETYTEDIKYDKEDKRILKERFYNKVKEEMVKIYG